MTEMPEIPDGDRDEQSDEQSETRRGVLRAGGLLAAGLGVGLLGRPLADDLAAPDEPIDRVGVDGREVSVHLAENPSIAGVVIVDGGGAAVKSWFHVPAVNPLIADLEPGEYRARALRGDTPAKTETVQEISFEVIA